MSAVTDAEHPSSPPMTIEEYADLLRQQIGIVYRNEGNASFLGPKYPRPLVGRNTQVTRDSIRNLADARGDLNPLFRDPEYARGTRYGCMVAPPTIVFMHCLATYPNPYSSAFAATAGGDAIEWFTPLCDGDELDVEYTATDVQIRPSTRRGRTIWREGRTKYFRRGGVPVATQRTWGMLWPKTTETAAHEHVPYQMPEHTEEYIQQVYAAQDHERARGAEARYWEDVSPGDELVPVVRGPHTAMESVAWTIGGQGQRLFVSDRIFRLIYENSGWGVWDPQLKIHRNDHDEFWQRGRHGGYGNQRASWTEMMLTNWMGDDGFLWKLRAEHRLYGGYGWVYWSRGTVVSKYVESGHHCVDIACRMDNQTDQEVLRGHATVILPTRDQPVTYPGRPEL